MVNDNGITGRNLVPIGILGKPGVVFDHVLIGQIEIDLTLYRDPLGIDRQVRVRHGHGSPIHFRSIQEHGGSIPASERVSARLQALGVVLIHKAIPIDIGTKHAQRSAIADTGSVLRITGTLAASQPAVVVVEFEAMGIGCVVEVDLITLLI